MERTGTAASAIETRQGTAVNASDTGTGTAANAGGTITDTATDGNGTRTSITEKVRGTRMGLRGLVARARLPQHSGLLGVAGGLLFGLVGCTGQQQTLPSVQVQVGQGQGDSLTLGVQLLLLLTVLSLVPAVVMMVTPFVRIAIVLSFARSAIGVAQVPPNQILLGLSLFLTIFVMAPVWTAINEVALQPYMAGTLLLEGAYEEGMEPLRAFMLKQTREKDIGLFLALGKQAQPNTPDDVPAHVLIPAFMISELKTAFQMGFLILLPFLVIDMVVSSTLMSMGMMMLPPLIRYA